MHARGHGLCIRLGMNLNIPNFSIESEISNLYATERWLISLCQSRSTLREPNLQKYAWASFIAGSRDRCAMLRKLAQLENCHITFDWIVPKCVLSYDFECLACDLMSDTISDDDLAESLDKLTRHIALQYVRLMRIAQAQHAYSVVMGTECILETMPREYASFLNEPMMQSA